MIKALSVYSALTTIGNPVCIGHHHMSPRIIHRNIGPVLTAIVVIVVAAESSRAPYFMVGVAHTVVELRPICNIGTHFQVGIIAVDTVVANLQHTALSQIVHGCVETHLLTTTGQTNIMFL